MLTPPKKVATLLGEACTDPLKGTTSFWHYNWFILLNILATEQDNKEKPVWNRTWTADLF